MISRSGLQLCNRHMVCTAMTMGCTTSVNLYSCPFRVASAEGSKVSAMVCTAHTHYHHILHTCIFGYCVFSLTRVQTTTLCYSSTSRPLLHMTYHIQVTPARSGTGNKQVCTACLYAAAGTCFSGWHVKTKTDANSSEEFSSKEGGPWGRDPE